MATIRKQTIKESTFGGIAAKGNVMATFNIIVHKGVTSIMDTNYYRITGYCEQEDFCFIMDCYGMFEKLWQFSSFLIQKGLKVLEVGNDTKFMDGNIDRIDENSEKMFLRASAEGKPEYTTRTINGVTYKAVKVSDKIYIPDRTLTV